jgi:hypothetical protein
MRHWTEDELIESVYGIGPADGHLDTCAACRSRRDLMEQRKSELGGEPHVSTAFLASQRRAVYTRAEQPVTRSAWLRAAVACAAVSVIAVGLVLSRPADTSAVDAQVIAEAYAAVAMDVPRAAQPIDALFEEAP